jgi:hypothetical protein
MIPQLLLGVIKSLVIDSATNLAKNHVEEMVKKNLSDDQQKVLNALINDDNSHDKKSLTDFLR